MSLGAGDAEDLLRQAVDGGINYFDTADIYSNGDNERLVGRALRDVRSRVIIASKVGNIPRSDGSGLDWNPTKSHILASIDGTLKRLQTDYLDLYQLHGGTIDDPIDDTIEAFEILKQQGKIRHYGISSIRPNVIREYVRRSAIVSVMMQYSLLDRRPEEECLPLLQQHSISLVVRGSVAQGLLAGKPARDYLDHTQTAVEETAAAVATIAGAHRTSAQIAVRYVLASPAAATAVVGIRTRRQLEEILATAGSPSLSEAELHLLASRSTPNFYSSHR